MSQLGHNATLGGGGFHHLALRAYDFDKTVDFYTNGLGFTKKLIWGEDGRDGGGVDSRAVMLDTGDGNYLEVFAGGARPGSEVPEGALFHFALRTPDVDAALERARAYGATVTVEPKTVAPPHAERPVEFRIAFVKGFDGEVIEFFYNPEL